MKDRIFLGCGNFGGIGSLPELCGLGEGPEEARHLLDLARELGIYRFDTANTYGWGRSEECLGAWLSEQSNGYRRQVQVATKVGNPAGTRTGRRPLCAMEIDEHVERSLDRLKLRRIPILYLHEPDSETPLQETIAALSGLIAAGKVEYLGVSNVDLKYVKRFLALSDDRVRGRLKYVQNEYHFLAQTDRGKLLPFLVEQGIQYIAFSPLAGGLLSGKYRLGEKPPEGSRLALRSAPYSKYLNVDTFARIAAFGERARRQGRSIQQEALRLVLETDGIAGAVIGPRKKEHYESLGFKFG